VTHIRRPSGLTASRTRQLSRSCSSPFPQRARTQRICLHIYICAYVNAHVHVLYVHNITCRCTRITNDKNPMVHTAYVRAYIIRTRVQRAPVTQPLCTCDTLTSSRTRTIIRRRRRRRPPDRSRAIRPPRVRTPSYGLLYFFFSFFFLHKRDRTNGLNRDPLRLCWHICWYIILPPIRMNVSGFGAHRTHFTCNTLSNTYRLSINMKLYSLYRYISHIHAPLLPLTTSSRQL
jgi:hypothetical protein